MDNCTCTDRFRHTSTRLGHSIAIVRLSLSLTIIGLFLIGSRNAMKLGMLAVCPVLQCISKKMMLAYNVVAHWHTSVTNDDRNQQVGAAADVASLLKFVSLEFRETVAKLDP